MIKVEEVIITDLERRGNGKDITSPIRRILQVYNKDGELIAEHDSYGTMDSALLFLDYCMAKGVVVFGAAEGNRPDIDKLAVEYFEKVNAGS